MKKIDTELSSDDSSVKTVDVYGSDARICDIARISHEDATTLRCDQDLIKWLISHNHGTPFEHCCITFLIECPVYVARQWFRYRMSSFLERSMRYCKAGDAFLLPDRVQDHEAHQIFADVVEHAFAAYDQMIGLGVPRELARTVLPLTTVTKFYWTANIREIMHFLDERLAPSAQAEIREYAKAIFKILSFYFPYTAQAMGNGFEK